METIDFLDRVLPERGLRVVVSMTEKGPRQTFHVTNLDAAEALLAADRRGANAYHGCAAFADNSSRKASNVECAKALWVDLDCGEGKPYPDQVAAGKAAVLFTKTVGLPPPLIVNSGRGLHVYWLLETEVRAADWQHAASCLKLAAQHAGLHADPSRTADIASILRTPGTHNRKAEPLAVLVVRDGSPAPYDYILGKLEAYCVAHDLNPLGAAPSHVKVDNSDLEIKYDGPPPRVEPILESCAIIREFYESGGNIEEPLWRACMGVVRHCQDGPELCHEWSAGYAGYTREETDAKIAGLEGTGPTTCNVLEAYRPDACRACPLFQKCKSPISAAYRAVEVSEIVDLEQPDAPAVEIPEMPDGFSWTTKGLYGKVWDKTKGAEGEYVDVKISDMLFYPIAWVTDTGTDRSLLIRSHIRKTQTEEWSIPCATIGEGGSKLRSFLAKKMITWEKGKDGMLQDYMMKYMSLMREQTHALSTYNRFGWHGRDFLIGTTLMKSDGSEVEVMLGGSAETQAESYKPVGDLATWVETVERAYNHPTLEPLQFAILTGMASPLLSMFKQYGGVTVYMHSQESGEGKTTISRAALSCYSSWEENQLSYTQYTTNALYATFGTANAMPVILDELTAMEGKEAAEMIHLISSGSPKKRCEKPGNLQKSDHRWATFALSSGNNLITEKISQYRTQAGAENARVFEYSIQGLRTPIPGAEAAKLFPKFAENHGRAGRVFLRYVVDNYDDVRALLLENHSKLLQKLRIAQSERYWGALIACVVTTHNIASQLGLVSFPLRNLLMFIGKALAENRYAMTHATPVAEDQIGRMLADLWPGLLITHGKGDVYKRWDAYVAKEVQGKATGRYIMRRPGPDGVNDTPVVYLAMSAVKDWCAQKNVSLRDLMREASRKGLIRPQEARVALGQGSVKYSGLGTLPCLVVNEAALPATMSPGVPTLSVVQGTQVKP